MRITNQMLQQSTLRDLRVRLEAVARARQQAATGRRVETMSDDPVGATRIMSADSELRQIDQYRRNGASATTRLTAEDVVLESVREVLRRARNLAVSASTWPVGDPQRDAAIAEIQLIRRQIISLGNTRVGDEYIFGGGQTTAPPFLADGTYVGDLTVRVTAIDDQVMMDTSHPGAPVLTDALAALESLESELQTGDQTSIEATTAALDWAVDQALTAQAIAGARLREIEQTAEGLSRRAVGLLDARQAIRDADPAESLLELAAAQAALERAYSAVGKVFETSLVDYLR
jgi:flagellar hook-associated protein 3 FlgL